MLYRIYLILSCILWIGNSKSNANILVEIPKGQVVDTIKCIDDRSQSYALYLPSYYTTNKKFPIVYIFEPGARGKLPLGKYYQIAEKYGYILVCSNNSRNGPAKVFQDAADAVLADTKFRFAVDTGRIYTMGFSGGARVAIGLAIKMHNIKGVIACGAGFPSDRQPNKYIKFTMVGLVGKLDMNYIELKMLEKELQKFNINCWVDYYDGEHDWPGKECMEDAFLYLQFDAMRRNLIKVDSDLCLRYKQEQLKLINSNDVYKNWVTYQKLQRFVNHLTDTEIIDNEINKYSIDQTVKSQIEIEKKYQQLELEWFEKIGTAFNKLDEYPILWWKGEAKKLNKAIDDSTDMEMNLIARRLNNMIYMNAFEILNLEENDFEKSEKILRIAQLARHLSPYPTYYLASIYAQQKKNSMALKMLKESIDNGFSNINYIRNDNNFKHLATDKQFLEIITAINK